MEQLSNVYIEQFINNGFVKIESAFSRDIADECRHILWKATQCDPGDPESWTQPVIRIPELALQPFVDAANTTVLHNAFDQLLGKGNWLPRKSMGSFPIRFPHKDAAVDTGWHVDASFPGELPDDYLEWRINVHSKGRGLLMLFLFSDVSLADAPTIIRKGSHLDVARILIAHGEQGLSFMELAKLLPGLPAREETFATGEAGTVYLCHPFLAHAAQNHHGAQPKFMAQPPLHTKDHFNINRPVDDLCPVELAILKGVGLRDT